MIAIGHCALYLCYTTEIAMAILDLNIRVFRRHREITPSFRHTPYCKRRFVLGTSLLCSATNSFSKCVCNVSVLVYLPHSTEMRCQVALKESVLLVRHWPFSWLTPCPWLCQPYAVRIIYFAAVGEVRCFRRTSPYRIPPSPTPAMCQPTFNPPLKYLSKQLGNQMPKQKFSLVAPANFIYFLFLTRACDLLCNLFVFRCVYGDGVAASFIACAWP